jgi:hypothetical protein
VGITAGSREVPGRKPVTRDNNNNNNDNNNNNNNNTSTNQKGKIIIKKITTEGLVTEYSNLDQEI